MDVHTKLMRRYKQVPEWWFMCILFINIAATLFICQYYQNELQLPWWGIFLACSVALFFTLPVGVITATTNQVKLARVILPISSVLYNWIHNKYALLYSVNFFVLVWKVYNKSLIIVQNIFLITVEYWNIVQLSLGQTDTSLECDHRVYYRLYIPRISCCQCMLQSIWTYKHETRDHLFERFQAWALHEDSSQGYVHGTG